MTITFSCFIDFDVLEDAISAGCLLMQCLVCLGCYVNRVDASATKTSIAVSTSVILVYLGSCLALGFALQEDSLRAAWQFVVIVLTAVGGCGMILVAMWQKTLVLDVVAPVLGIAVNLVIMASKGGMALAQLMGYFAVISIPYFFFGRYHSTLNETRKNHATLK